jgi:FkbM family methyltransferase
MGTDTQRTCIRRLEPWLDGKIIKRLLRLCNDHDLPGVLRAWVLPELMDGEGRLHIAGSVLDVPSIADTWVLVREVFERQEYWFADDDRPCRIVDGGAHCGLAVAFFKAVHPESEIVALEPRPDLADMLRINVRRNGWKGVEVVEAAISSETGTGLLAFDPKRSMSGTLTTRHEQSGRAIVKRQVKTVSLQSLLGQRVDLLKLDIEGSEHVVLPNSGEALVSVQRIFAEVHGQPKGGLRGLGKIVSVLEECGMDVLVARSMGTHRRTEVRPFSFLAEAPAVLVYGARQEAAAADRSACDS